LVEVFAYTICVRVVFKGKKGGEPDRDKEIKGPSNVRVYYSEGKNGTSAGNPI